MAIEFSGGLVSIEDGTKAAEEFAPARKVKVEIRFDIDAEQGSHHDYLDQAAEAANAKVNELLGRKQTADKSTRKPRATSTKEPANVVDTSTPGSDKAALEAAAGLMQAPVEQKKPEPVQADIEDNIDDLLGDAAPVPITDAELAKAAQNKNAQMKIKDPNFSVKIRALVVEYAGNPPKKITDVPVAKRQEFLDKLRDLT